MEIPRFQAFYEIARGLPHGPVVIAGTDTDVGKTWVTGHLAGARHALGYPVITQKWVQTGPGLTDIATHDAQSGLVFPEHLLVDRLPYYFPEPVSPHLGASLVGQTIDPDVCLAATQRLQAHYQVLLEGSGGLMVPYSETLLWIDLLAALRFPVLLVSENRVGAINQVLLSLAALRQRQISILGVVLSQKNKTLPHWIAVDNQRVIAQFFGGHVWRV